MFTFSMENKIIDMVAEEFLWTLLSSHETSVFMMMRFQNIGANGYLSEIRSNLICNILL